MSPPPKSNPSSLFLALCHSLPLSVASGSCTRYRTNHRKQNAFSANTYNAAGPAVQGCSCRSAPMFRWFLLQRKHPIALALESPSSKKPPPLARHATSEGQQKAPHSRLLRALTATVTSRRTRRSLVCVHMEPTWRKYSQGSHGTRWMLKISS